MTSRSRLRPLARAARLAPFGLALALALAGCSSSGTPEGTTSPTADASAAPSGDPSGDASDPQPGGFTGQPGGGGVSGTIAYVSGQTMQVQDSDSQTAVSWTDATMITSQVSGTLADVVPGACVVAIAAGDAGAATSSDAATPSADPAASSGVATRVTITEPVDGACQATGGFGGAGGGFPGGGTGQAPTDLPSGMPTDLPSGVPTDLPSGGAPDGGTLRAFGAFTSGLVTAVDGSTITVETTAQDGTASTATATVDASTTYTKTVAADASAVVVGQCVTARGEADSSGAVAATTLTVTAPVDGACTTFARAGSGGFGGTRGGTGGTAPGGAGATTDVAPAAALLGATTGGTDA